MKLCKLIILGASGNAHDVLDIVEAINERKPSWLVAGFLDDGLLPGHPFLDRNVLGPLSAAGDFPDCQFINCIGSDGSYLQRCEAIDATRLDNSRFATLVHPLASVASRAGLGRGVYISFACSVGGNASLGNHVSLAPGVIVGHDCRVADHVIMAPGAVVSGYARIGQSVYLGARCSVKQHQVIGAKARVGMGAVVTRDVEPATTVIGVPARAITEPFSTNLPTAPTVPLCEQ